MSLIPPAPLILSKLKYHIRKRLANHPERMEQALADLGPYYLFRLTASFRSLENGTTNDLADIHTYIESPTVRWDCVDTALNMFTRMKNYLRLSIKSPGVLRLAICHRTESAAEDDPWSDMYVDEFPINVVGIRDEKGVELTLKN
jgi:hypothetical protein